MGKLLSEAEREFIEEMGHEDEPGSWHNFDPDFLQRDLARFIRRRL